MAAADAPAAQGALLADYLPLLRLRTPIVPAQLQNNAGIVGAAMASELDVTATHK